VSQERKSLLSDRQADGVKRNLKCEQFKFFDYRQTASTKNKKQFKLRNQSKQNQKP
jgi:hypothetical protein